MKLRRGTAAEPIAFAVDRGQDLYEELTAAAIREDLRSGAVWCIGALERARVAFYDQATHRYEEHAFDEPVEIASCSGSVALKEGKPFLHLHAVLSDRSGRAHGGHVLPGCIVFACEGFILPVAPPIERRHDPGTGLHLWRF